LAFSLDDPEQMKLLTKLNEIRKEKCGKGDRRYLPVEVTDKGVQNAIMVADLPQDDKRRESLYKPDQLFTTPDVVEEIEGSTPKETQNDENNAEAVGAEVVEGRVEQGEDASELVEVEGGSLEEDAGDRTTNDDKPERMIASANRSEIVKMTLEDETLKMARNLADKEQNGYKWDEGLLFKFQLDHLGNSSKRLCVPKPLRVNCLGMAHERFGHSGKNKVGKEVARFFYWPSLYSDVALNHVTLQWLSGK